MCTFTAQIPFALLTWPERRVDGVIKIYQSTQPQHEVFSAIPLFSLYNLTFLFTCNLGFKISPNYHLKLQKESNYLSIIPFHLVNRENIIFLWIHCAGKAGHKHPSKWKRLSLSVDFGQTPSGSHDNVDKGTK